MAKTTLKIGMEESYCGIVALYDKVAEMMGYENTDNLNYDCKEISVASNIADNVFAYYREQGASREEIGMSWVCFGPKAVDTLPDDTVEVEDGFITVKEAEVDVQ